MLRCVIRGSGDVGSAIAHALFRAGHGVVLHDEPWPAHSRRGMAFVDGWFDGWVELAGVAGKRAPRLQALPLMLRCRRAIPLTADSLTYVLRSVQPDVLIDARLRKRIQPEPQIGLAPLTIGLGPHFVARQTTDVAIETAWGDSLGRVIRDGGTLPLTGEPRPLGGYGRERFVYAPRAGLFRTARAIGESVSRGDRVATLAGHPLEAPLSGCLRGLTHDGAWVEAGMKVIEIDPRNAPSAAFGLGERPERIAAGVLSVLLF